MFPKMRKNRWAAAPNENIGQYSDETIRKTPEAQKNNCLESIEEEYLTTRSILEDEDCHKNADSWNWICGKLAYFKIRGLKRSQYSELCWYAIRLFRDQYNGFFSDYLNIIGSITYITDACERYLSCGNLDAAYSTAVPCMTYLKQYPERYSRGQLCFASPEEAVLFAAEQGDNGEKRAEDNYTGFFLCYARIVNGLLEVSDMDGGELRQERDLCLELAAKLSPYNAAIWEFKAAVCRSIDRKKYWECINNALKYSVAVGAPYGIGQVYANLAVYYSDQNYALAHALCEVSRRFGGYPEEAEVMLSGCQYDPFPDAELAVHQAGIQVGFSNLARMAQDKAQEYKQRLSSKERNEEDRRIILTASDSDYQYEVRDPMTVVGRSSAMSEYLRLKPTVSRIHARLIKENETFYVSDMDAMNGTYVNGIRIGAHRQILRDGDELRLGSSSDRGAKFILKTKQDL